MIDFDLSVHSMDALSLQISGWTFVFQLVCSNSKAIICQWLIAGCSCHYLFLIFAFNTRKVKTVQLKNVDLCCCY